MSYERVGTVLKEVCDFHRRESDLFGRLAQEVRQPRAKLLLESMSDHERQLAAGLSEYVAGAPVGLLNTWLGRQLDLPSALAISDPELPDDATVDELLQLGLDLDDRLLEVLQECADCCGPDGVRQLFRTFVEQQQQEERLLARQAMRAIDL
ncbi:MAG: hypothetical protein CMJ58_12140 [Planctomycetaceae bacterium]|nr:hypothetical protein [Planctomycetaceae bacterium]